ncbi:MAG: MotA/TolQ/ExbB proton channel family protein [bacterium]|nr:MotA/TolQ/ExbB proton channel family protein [bacterium]
MNFRFQNLLTRSALGLAVLAAPAFALAQGQGERLQEPSAIENATSAFEKKYEEALEELRKVREQVTREKLDLMPTLRQRRDELIDARREFQERSRMLETRALSLTNLEDTIKWLEQDATSVRNLLSDYMRNFESRIHIAERGRYAETIKSARLAMENTGLPAEDVAAAQVAVLGAALDRLEDAVGGTTFEGQAVASDGLVTDGKFVLVGPAAVFLSQSGRAVGTIEDRDDSNQPSIAELPAPELAEATKNLVTAGVGDLPVDPSLGEAAQVAALQETYWEHLQKGGVVMYPMFVLAGAALLVALWKWIGLMMVRMPSNRRLNELMQSVSANDQAGAREEATSVPGPIGRMLRDGVEHMDDPRELVEEVMYEHTLSMRLKLQRMLPFIAITAASAPLLGLLGTVTGIMKTFGLMTVVGSGNAKALSSGISEALITTETGLYVAIPSLLLHAFLSRKAKGIVDRMEKAAVAFVNRLGQKLLVVDGLGHGRELAGAGNGPGQDMVPIDRVRELVTEMLATQNGKDQASHPA